MKRIYEQKFLVSFQSLTNVKITKYFNYRPRFNFVFSRNSLFRRKYGAFVINIDYKKVKKHIGFHYLLTEILPFTLILLELNIYASRSIEQNQR